MARAWGSTRAVPRVRRWLSQRLRALRRQRGISQERLGRLAGLSGKFIGEVERGQKSISLDSIYRVAQALGVPVRALTDVPTRVPLPPPEADEVYALLSRRRRPGEVQRACRVLRAVLGRAS